jgi:hypothetical protein
MSNDSSEWHWCLDHNAAEPATTSCPPSQRWGPYPSKEAAEHWRERAEARDEQWDAEDRAWEGES